MMRLHEQSSGLCVWYERLARIAFYVMVFFVPLAYFPWTSDSLEFNKQTLVLIFTSISVIAWLGLMIKKKSIVIKFSNFFIVLGALLISVIISSLFSISPYLSWVGHSQQEYTSLLTLFGLVLMVVIGSTFLSEIKAQKYVWLLLLLSSAFIGLLVCLSAFGLKFLDTSFIGTPNALGFYLVTISSIACGLLLIFGRSKRDLVLFDGFWGFVLRGSAVMTITSTLLVMMMLDYWLLWLAMLLGLAVTFAFTLIKTEDFPSTSAFIFPMILFVSSLIFLPLSTPLVGLIPGEISPTFSASWSIATETLSDSSWLFGSGPGTYVIDYTKFHQASVNQTSLWDARFDRSSSHVLTMIPTFGVLGTLLFILMMLWVGGSAINQLLKTREQDKWKMTYLAFSGWVVLALSFFIYSWNFTLIFLFFLLSAVIIAQSPSPIKVLDFAKSPRLSLATAFMFVLSFVGLLTLLFVSLSRYGADIAFAKAVSNDKSGQPIDQVISNLNTAVSLNRWNDIYYRNLANAQLIKLGNISTDPSVKAADVQALVSGSINSARRAVDLSPAQVVNWSLLGDIYRDVAPIVGGADAFAISSYQEAILLSPNNPKYYVALSRAFLTQADLQGVLLQSEDKKTANDAEAIYNGALGSAIVNLQKAVDLIPDYAPAHYYLAATYERQGNLSEAIAKMELLRNSSLGDVGVSFQLGMLYLRQGKTEQAQAELERALTIAPNFSNALWFLSAIYEQKGDFVKAIDLVEQVAKYNPNDEAVKQRLIRLESGKALSELPPPLEDPAQSSTVTD